MGKGMGVTQGNGTKIVVSKKVSVAGLGKGNMMPHAGQSPGGKGGVNLTKTKNTKGM